MYDNQRHVPQEFIKLMRQILSNFSDCMEIELIQYKMNISLLAMWANDCVVSQYLLGQCTLLVSVAR